MYFYERDAFCNTNHLIDNDGNIVVSYSCNAYNTILMSTANSVVNVYWRGRILKNQVKKYRPCIGRTISFSLLSFMLFFLTIAGILPSVEDEDKNIVFFFIIIFFLLHILFVLYSLLKLNSPIYLGENKMSQKQFGQIINIEYDKISDAKLSFAYYLIAVLRRVTS